MVFLQELNLSPVDSDTPYERSLRLFIHGTKPFAANSIVFQAHTPPETNIVDRMSPLLIMLVLAGFLTLY